MRPGRRRGAQRRGSRKTTPVKEANAEEGAREEAEVASKAAVGRTARGKAAGRAAENTPLIFLDAEEPGNAASAKERSLLVALCQSKDIAALIITF